jgi:hypothetical protein
LIVINSNKSFTSKVIFLSTSTLKSPKTTIGQIVGDFDISSWNLDKEFVKDKDGGL